MWILMYSFSDTYYVWAACDAGKHVLAVFKLGITRMNNKAISEFDFRRIRRIKQISEGIIHLGR